MTATMQQTDTFRLRAVFAKNTQLFFGELDRDIGGFKAFLDVALVAQVHTNPQHAENIDLIYLGDGDVWGTRTDADRFIVHRVSYNSPLEIVVALPIVFGVGHQAISLFHRFQDARRKKAETDTDVEAEALLRQLIGFKSMKLSKAQQHYTDQALPKAAGALEDLTELGEDQAS